MIRPDVAALLPAAEEWILRACSARADRAEEAVFAVGMRQRRRVTPSRLPPAPSPSEITARVVDGALRDLEHGLLEHAC